MKLGSPTKLEIKPNAEKTEFRFLLSFREQPRIFEFALDDAGLMYLMHALQHLQARHRIPIPDQIRPRGKPTLRVVTPKK